MVVIERKVKGGKLIRAQVHFNGDTIRFIKITGDFFMYPEDAIMRIERGLVGKKLESIESVIQKLFSNIECIGFSYSDLHDIIMEAYRCGE